MSLIEIKKRPGYPDKGLAAFAPGDEQNERRVEQGIVDPSKGGPNRVRNRYLVCTFSVCQSSRYSMKVGKEVGRLC